MARKSSAGNWHRWFLAPTGAVLVLTAVMPLVYTVTISLGRPTGPGDESYSSLLRSAAFYHAVVVEVIFVVASVLVEVVLGVALAHVLSLPGRVTGFVRGVVLGPTMLPTIVVALVFSYMLQSGTGVVSYLLRYGGFHQAWLDNGPTALAVLVGIDAWQFTPFVALLVLAGLQGIPKDTLEAGRVDGAGWYRLYRHITLPQLMPVIVAAGLLRFIDAIQVFPTIYVLTNGGPGTSTSALNFYGYEQYFQFHHKTAGAAIAVILMVATIAVALGLTMTSRLGGSRGR